MLNLVLAGHRSHRLPASVPGMTKRVEDDLIVSPSATAMISLSQLGWSPSLLLCSPDHALVGAGMHSAVSVQGERLLLALAASAPVSSLSWHRGAP